MNLARPVSGRTLLGIGLAFAVVAVAVRAVFWAYTGRVWEDALITILHAENAVRGLGLTHFKVDEPRIHGFTSPLSVLIPLVGEWIRPGFGLGFMRLASLVAAFLSVVLAALIARRVPELRLGAPLLVLACGYLALEHHQALWGMAGMETQVVVCVLLFSILCLASAWYRALGVAVALCLLVRPDYAMWVMAIAAILAWQSWRERDWRPLVQVVVISALLYAPWIVFTTWYYGSPVPNTILAKSGGYTLWWRYTHGVADFLVTAWQQLWWKTVAPLGPTFAGNGTGFMRLFDPGWIAGIMSAMVVVSLAAAAATRARRVLWIHAFFWLFLLYYVFLVPNIFGWYIVPLMSVAILLAAHGIAVATAPLGQAAQPVRWAIAVAYLAAIAGVLPLTYRGEREIQHRVEEPVRIAIGKWLHDNTPPATTIGGEPLGFIGYHSRRTYYDYPGLASRRVVDFLRTSPRKGLFPMLMHFNPDYVVLRDSEVEVARSEPVFAAWLEEAYEPLRRYEVPAADRAHLLLPQWNTDLAFTLFRRRPAAQRPPLVEASRVGAELTVTGVQVEGDWSESGAHPTAPPFTGGRWYASWSGADGNSGRLQLRFRPPATGKVAIPLLTGPATGQLSLRILEGEGGRELARLSVGDDGRLPVRSTAWHAWTPAIDPPAAGAEWILEARDEGRGWGQWFAVGMPREATAGPAR